MNRRFSTVIAIVLFALMFFKVSSFHVYIHIDTDSDEIENCEICDFAIENQNTEFLSAGTHDIFNDAAVIYSNEQLIKDVLVVYPSILRSNLFGRPPPYLA